MSRGRKRRTKLSEEALDAIARAIAEARSRTTGAMPMGPVTPPSRTPTADERRADDQAAGKSPQPLPAPGDVGGDR
jgi:hypothetical protein